MKPLCCHNFIMTLLTNWISAPTAFLLLYFWRAKVHASGNPEDEIDYTYVIIGVTLGAVLAIGFVAVIICMIKAQMIDSVFGDSDGKMDRRSNTGSSQNR
ncbi:transmembrane protein 273 [Oenanthe melanoleuca]|uniref:transmembrane protein 273 n=1 Tax=Oenanthe melanoleuca TaxID=2939378 RepID=UPI0024C12FD4|nr:transmembrane protein 273 [Oenanthe melanoleuca]